VLQTQPYTVAQIKNASADALARFAEQVQKGFSFLPVDVDAHEFSPDNEDSTFRDMTFRAEGSILEDVQDRVLALATDFFGAANVNAGRVDSKITFLNIPHAFSDTFHYMPGSDSILGIETYQSLLRIHAPVIR
jgi:hypothetical protein